jgi:divalent metal cation (Fe/Co/Zn/Cd) transporter
VVGLNILVTGARLVHESSTALMDTSDPKLLDEICRVIAEHRRDIWIDVHQLRARRAGATVLIDFHLILPRDLSLEESHREVKILEKILNDHYQGQADILIHADPCTEPECPICALAICEERTQETTMQRLWRRETLTCEGSQINRADSDRKEK